MASDRTRLLRAILTADLALCAWIYFGKPGARCPACRQRFGLAPHHCVWKEAADGAG